MDINLFYIQQSIDNVTDREAVGGQFEYSSEHYFVSGYVDYDVHFSELNAAIINGRYRSEGGTHVSLAMNYRKSPYLTTRNALIGQQVDNITDLQEILGIDDPDQLDELALDRTFDSSLINLYINQPITKELDINTTITVSELSDTPASAGVSAFEGTGVEYYVSTQLVARDLFSERDSGYLGLTYASRTGSDVYSISSYYRYQLNSNWRLYPRLTVQQRDNDNGTGQTRYSLQLRSEYKFNKKHRIDGRLSGDWYRNSTRFGEHKFATYFFNLGYTYSF
jgi:hypothetical protein